jgi:hypothetical protein
MIQSSHVDIAAVSKSYCTLMVLASHPNLDTESDDPSLSTLDGVGVLERLFKRSTRESEHGGERLTREK